MRAQVILTPTEAKCFISKAIARMDIVKKAATGGMIVVHPSSSAYFLVKELTRDIPRTDCWMMGAVFSQGLCVDANATIKQPPAAGNEPLPKLLADRFPFTWLIKDHKLISGMLLGKILEEMGPRDVYVKGCNAVDLQGRTGVLFGHDGGGTIARVMGVQKEKKFNVILAVGLEKLIPISILEAAKAIARKDEIEYDMGMRCGSYPVNGGTTVTEIQAVEILSGAHATPIAAGGVGGAEGATILVIDGTKEQVASAIEYVEQSKGVKLPIARPLPCNLCGSKDCHFPIRDKHWYPRWG
jgi:hypothetical protein